MFGVNESIHTLSEDDFGTLRQIVYETYNPSKLPPISKRPKWYLQFESAYTFNAMRQFKSAIKSDNRFRILLSTARIAKMRQQWHEMYFNAYPNAAKEGIKSMGTAPTKIT